MGGGYTACYYSYIWAEVLDCDAYGAYTESGDIFNADLADRFRRYILTPGGIDDAMDMYKNYRGQEPDVKGLLLNRGLYAAKQWETERKTVFLSRQTKGTTNTEACAGRCGRRVARAGGDGHHPAAFD